MITQKSEIPHALRVLAAFTFLTVPTAFAAPQRYNHGNPTVSEQLMLELVNRARANPAAEAALFGISLNSGLTSGTISASPKAPLAFNLQLIQSAKAHSQWMLDTDIFDHTGAGGSSPTQRMAAAGYLFTGSYGSGENIAWGGTSSTPDLIQMTFEQHESLFRSPGHRTNICGENYSEIGIGLLAGRFQGFNALVATQNYANSASSPNPFLLGVIFQDADGDGIYDAGEGVSGVTITPESGAWDAVSSESGGYAIPITGSGTARVNFQGRGLDPTFTRSVQLTGNNVKLDLVIPSSTTLSQDVSTNNGTSPEITVSQTSGQNLANRVGSLKFGTVKIGRKSRTQIFFLTNTGGAPLHILGISAKGRNSSDFMIKAPRSISLLPGARIPVKVTFKPSSKGNSIAKILILSDDSTNREFKIKMNGLGQ